MKHILPFLALLWAVAADDELVGGGDVPSKLQARLLGNKQGKSGKNKKTKCTPKSGVICLIDQNLNVQVKVDGDLNWFRKQDGATHKKCEKKARTITNRNTRRKKFCAYFDKTLHQLIAPRFARHFIIGTGVYKEMNCEEHKMYGRAEKYHEVEMRRVKNS